MCNSIAEGGDRCPNHRHLTKAFITAVQARHSGLARRQVEKLFSELRREGRNSKVSESIFEWTKRAFLTSLDDLPEPTQRKIAEQLAASGEAGESFDPPTMYALMTLGARAEEREAAMEKFYSHTSNRTGLGEDEVKRRFWEQYRNVDVSRTAELPAEYTQEARLAAAAEGLPYDRASVTAFAKLNALPGTETRRRVTLTNPKHRSNVIAKYGYHEGRLELVFHSNPNRTYTYRNVSEAQWVMLKESTYLGQDWRFLSNGKHYYRSQEEAEADSTASKCEKCGAFRSINDHAC